MSKEFKHVLVPIDFSENAEEALETAFKIFGDAAETFSLLTVCESITNRHTELVAEIDEMITKSINEQMMTFCEKYKGRHKNLQTFVKKGSASSQILSAAKELDVDLIVMSSQGASSLARVFFGHTTYNVSRKAHCSVFVVRS